MPTRWVLSPFCALPHWLDRIQVSDRLRNFAGATTNGSITSQLSHPKSQSNHDSHRDGIQLPAFAKVKQQMPGRWLPDFFHHAIIFKLLGTIVSGSGVGDERQNQDFRNLLDVKNRLVTSDSIYTSHDVVSRCVESAASRMKSPLSQHINLFCPLETDALMTRD